MTVASENNRAGPYTGNGVTQSFAYGFRIVNQSHLQVVRTDADGVETVLSLASQYTVTGVGASGGGSVVLTAPLASGHTLTILRDVPFTQETDLENQGAYYAETIEDALDLGVMRDQQLKEAVDRSLKIAVGASSVELDKLVVAVRTVSDNIKDIVTVADNVDAVNTVSGIDADVSVVADNAGDVTWLAGVYYGPSATDPVTRRDGSALLGGDFYFNTVTGLIRVWGGGDWQSQVKAAGVSTYHYVATAGQTVFIGADASSNVLFVEAGSLLVTLNGVALIEGDDFTVTGGGNSVTLAVGADVSDDLVVLSFDQLDFAGTILEMISLRDEAAMSAAQAALYDGPWRDTVADLLADMTMTYAAGSASSVVVGGYVRTRADGFSYQVAASGATDHHIATAGGVKLYVMPACPIDLTAFGATTTADIRVKLQAAIDLSGSSGYPVFIPEGEWGLSDFVIMRPGSRIDLSDSATLKLIVTDKVMFRNWDDGGIYLARTAFGDWSINGGTLDGNATALASSSSLATLFKAKNVTFNGCRIRDVAEGHAFDLVGMKGVNFVNCRFEDYTRGDSGASEFIQLDVAYPRALSAHHGPFGFADGIDDTSFDFTACDGIYLVNCTATRTGTVIGSHGAGGWVNSDSVTDRFHKNIRIDGLIVTDCKSAAIAIQRWSDFSIKNVFGYGGSDAREFIYVNGSNKFTIENCHGRGGYAGVGVHFVKQTFGYGDELCRDWLVDNVSVDGNTDVGMDFEGCAAGTVTRAKVRNSTSHGIRVRLSFDVVVQDFDVANVGASSVGVTLNDATRCQVVRGLVSGTFSTGIGMFSCTECGVLGSRVTGLVAGRRGVWATSSTRPFARNNIISGTAGTGVDLASTCTGAWADGNDMRGMTGGTKLVNAGSGAFSSNNQG